MDKTTCLRCGGRMSAIGTEKLQLGQAGVLTGMWSNLLAGAMSVEVYVCAECSKIEFYADTAANRSDGLPQNKCPQCGKIMILIT